MAKGNMLLGYSRGAVGDVVFRRSKGEQVTSARNRRPNNPKTEAQQRQRSVFSGALLFHKQMSSRFFKFAYEDKTQRESDFNAFMRHNTSISPLIIKEATASLDYPVFAPFEVTQGSLPSLSVSAPALSGTSPQEFQVSVNEFADLSSDTVGEWSQKLIEAYPSRFRAGDIITFVSYAAIENGFAIPPVGVPAFPVQVQWWQIILDTTDTRGLLGEVAGFDGEVWKPHREVQAAGYIQTDALAVTVIHSRNVSGGLQVSTQSLQLSPLAQSWYNSANRETASDYYKSIIMQSWEASSPALLQGGAAKKNTVVAQVSEIYVNGSLVTEGATLNPAAGVALTLRVLFTNDNYALLDVSCSESINIIDVHKYNDVFLMTFVATAAGETAEFYYRYGREGQKLLFNVNATA